MTTPVVSFERILTSLGDVLQSSAVPSQQAAAQQRFATACSDVLSECDALIMELSQAAHVLQQHQAANKPGQAHATASSQAADGAAQQQAQACYEQIDSFKRTLLDSVQSASQHREAS